MAMTAADVIEVLDCLKEAGVDVCIDGGWGIDALVGEQTREHEDLDLAVDRDDLENAQQALAEHGFHHDATLEPGLPTRFVLRDEPGRQVDFHPLVFGERGDGWQQLSESGKAWGSLPGERSRLQRGDRRATGTVLKPAVAAPLSSGLRVEGSR
jgi:lincosamide nucleotidyltransferase A/C/D/E